MRLEIWTQPNDRTRAKPKRLVKIVPEKLHGCCCSSLVWWAIRRKRRRSCQLDKNRWSEVNWNDNVRSLRIRVSVCVRECSWTVHAIQLPIHSNRTAVHPFSMVNKQEQWHENPTPRCACWRIACLRVHVLVCRIRKGGEELTFSLHALSFVSRASAMHYRLHMHACTVYMSCVIECGTVLPAHYLPLLAPRHHRLRFVHLRCVCFDLWCACLYQTVALWCACSVFTPTQNTHARSGHIQSECACIYCTSKVLAAVVICKQRLIETLLFASIESQLLLLLHRGYADRMCSAAITFYALLHK